MTNLLYFTQGLLREFLVSLENYQKPFTTDGFISIWADTDFVAKITV
jgi:hypothetical protein